MSEIRLGLFPVEDTTKVDMVITSRYVIHIEIHIIFTVFKLDSDRPIAPNKLNARNSADAITTLIKREFKL